MNDEPIYRTCQVEFKDGSEPFEMNNVTETQFWDAYYHQDNHTSGEIKSVHFLDNMNLNTYP